MTQEVTKFGEDALISLAEQLKTITPDQYTPPKSKPPEGGRKVGELSDYERQLYSLLEAANGAHKALHDASGLPFGSNVGIDDSHRQIHLHLAIAKMMLGESLSQTNPVAQAPGAILCDDWGIYLDEEMFSRPGMAIFIQV